ncbi:2Fe-2S iron-sulfur cluster binding domain-containing protein [Amycolatopsis sp.]|uniref:2Fe-2S iron-sulfur cluster-binding protein n=1 Tax=Amycolatopsis sp. TaxID=37632 RepID=UPI002D00E23E|nr:2Fe-2S iron-sulfur cluster binding domain-containing protein [Amycolatopsis sp.]HVV08107.1 2Fe-2S iron-sulfur cluster binding domain-containing protein [Amycolatopsis sp.]
MAEVRVEPAGFELTVLPGETVLSAAFRAGVSWPTICYGQARCTACALLVREGHQHAGPIGETERGVLRQITGRRRQWSSRDTRLACRLTVTGAMTIEKKGAKPTEPRSSHDPADS